MAVTGNVASAAHRQRVLRALGVVPYVLRAPPVAAPVAVAPQAADGAAFCVLVLPRDCAAAQLAFIERILHALGPAFARAPRVQVAAGSVQGEVPYADAYLAFGEPQAQGLGRALDAAAQARADVVLLDAPDALHDAVAKRRLWQAVAGLRRRLRQSSTAEP